MALVFLSLGSNLGDRRVNLSDAIGMIESSVGMVLLTSGEYETQSWGYESSNLFLNLVIKIESDLEPEEILVEVKNIEHKLGRTGENSEYADRPIDIDILFYDDKIITTEMLVIPHLLIQQRMFVLEPLNEIAHEEENSAVAVSISELLKRLIEKPSRES